MKDKLEQYIIGMEIQLEDARKQAAMIEGAIQFAKQLLDDLSSEEGEVVDFPPSQETETMDDD